MPKRVKDTTIGNNDKKKRKHVIINSAEVELLQRLQYGVSVR
jgi:hypothetical protein